MAPVLLIMHSVGLPKQRHTDVRYADILRTLESFFDQKMKEAIAAGVGARSDRARSRYRFRETKIG